MKKFLIVAIAAFVVHIGIGFAFYAGVMASYIQEVFKEISRTEEMMWPYFLRSALIALVMAYVYKKVYGGGNPWAEGLRFGAMVGIVLAGASGLDMYAMLPIAGKDMILMFVPEFFSYIFMGTAIGAIYGKVGEKGSATI